MKKTALTNTIGLLFLTGALFGVACSSSQNSTRQPSTVRTFVFAPRVGTPFRHEMKNLEEFAVAGSNFRDSVESRVLWEVTVIEPTDSKYIYRRRLLDVGLKVNGADVLTGSGPEVERQHAQIEQMMSRDGQVLDITGVEQMTNAIQALTKPAYRARVSEIYSAENVRLMLLSRAVDAFNEVVGKPIDLGSTWSAKADYGPLRGKSVLVDSSVGCGPSTCRKLIRTYEVDKEKMGDSVRRRVAAAMTESGIDPAAVQMVGAELKVEDTFVVEPETCQFHDASLVQQGKFVFQGPKGNKLEVVLTNKQTSHAEYPAAT